MHTHAKPAHKTLALAIVFILGFAIVEAIAAWWSGSLALLGDAGHMASDSVALAIAAFAAWFALKPPSAKHSYGLGRAEIIAAWISSLLMLLISIAIIVEAIQRFENPTHVKATSVIIVGFFGLCVNLFVAWMLSRNAKSLNVRAAILHVISDALGSVAALLSGIVIYFFDWPPIDPLLSLVIAVLIMFSSIQLLRETLNVLMESVPAHLNLKKVARTMMSVKGVSAVHDLHIWTLSSGMVVLSAHVDIDDLGHWSSILEQLSISLRNHYEIEHVTLQPEISVQVLKYQSKSEYQKHAKNR
ncbi:MAG TPA: cation diffusion facilitator family transporter [Coxiellaceae bacterium]|nr:cation diffusion facilitator family transporter [Coxiellaceae bacterium]